MKKFVKRNTIFLLTLCATSFACATENMSELEMELFNAGLIDEDLKYTDLQEVGKYFQSQNKMLSVSLPSKIDSLMEVSSILLTPYYMGYTFKFDAPISKDKFKRMHDDLNSTNTKNKLCQEMYTERLYKVNNVVIGINYIDTSMKSIANVELNPKTCI